MFKRPRPNFSSFGQILDKSALDFVSDKLIMQQFNPVHFGPLCTFRQTTRKKYSIILFLDQSFRILIDTIQNIHFGSFLTVAKMSFSFLDKFLSEKNPAPFRTVL